MTQAAESPAAAAGVTWDLQDLFAGTDDPHIDETLAQCRADAEAFAARYRGTVNVPGGPAPLHLLAGVREAEALDERADRVAAFAYLLYAADTTKPAHRDLQQKVEQRLTELRNTMLFFELEWLDLPEEDVQRLLAAPELAPYAHHLYAARKFAPHKLSEPEEKVVNEKDVTGIRAWGRLHTELTSSLQFPLTRDGQVLQLTLEEILALFHEPDRSLRRAAFETLYATLSGQKEVRTFIYDTILQDHLTMDRLRHFPDPMAARHLANEVDPQAVAAVMEATEANHTLAQEYWRLKARLLELAKLEIYDQYAPVTQEGGRKVPFTEARDLVLEAYGTVYPQFRQLVEDFFTQRWIDAEPRPGKQGGAFCYSPSPQLHPYVLCSYTGTARDAMTVAHELGHGLHGLLARKQTPFNYHSSLPLAETASVFGEIMVFDRLVQRETEPRARLGMLCSKIEDAFATVFRQNVITRFEQKAFAAREQGRLTPDGTGERWLEANAPYYGDAVALTPGYEWGWSYIPHFIHTRFYCYAYVFGELLVLALYRMHQELGEAFVPRYIQLLEAGGSDGPDGLLAPLGIDTRDPSFWQKGFDELTRLVRWAQQLAA